MRLFFINDSLGLLATCAAVRITESTYRFVLALHSQYFALISFARCAPCVYKC